jgi:iron complex transport system substrate-binding protein
MRVVSHTCSNTEIVCALGCADRLIAIDNDSDFPPGIVAPLPKLGRDLNLDIEAVRALKPDLVLTSLTVPGHERIVGEIAAAGLPHRVIDPRSLDDVFTSIVEIAAALDVPERGHALVRQMRAAMPPVAPTAKAPRILVEWWPKPVIGAARQSWVHDLIERAGARNALAEADAPTVSCDPQQPPDFAIDAVAISWCGVQADKYRADIVLQRPGWQHTAAVRNGRVHAISEAFLGRPGPRLVDGYRALRRIVESID